MFPGCLKHWNAEGTLSKYSWNIGRIFNAGAAIFCAPRVAKTLSSHKTCFVEI